MTITLNGTTGITTPDVDSDGLTVDSTTLVVDEANNRVGIGTSSPNFPLSFGANIGKTIAVFENAGTSVYGIGMGGAGSAGDPYRTKFFSNGSERMAISDTGNFTVGTTIYNPVSNNVIGFSVRGQYGETQICTDGAVSGAPLYLNRKTNDGSIVEFRKDGSTVGSVTVTGSSAAYNTSSDYRLKENVVGVTSALARVQQLNPVRFNFITDPDRTVDGFLAHEVHDVVPEAITGTKDATEMVDVYDEEGNVTGQEERPVYQGIDQSKLVPLLTAALQEALAKIDDLTARVSALEASNV